MTPPRFFRRSLLGRISVDEEVKSELAFHIDMTIRELMEHGMNEKQARAEAERRFGNTATFDAECRRFAHERDRRDQHAEYRHELTQDIAFAARQLLKAPSFALITILTLALGIGATAAVFSILNAVVLRPLPFDDANRVIVVYSSDKGDPHSPSAPDFLELRNVHEFEHVAAAVLQAGATLQMSGPAETLGGGRVTADYFAVFGVRPEIGRTFTPEEDKPGAANVVVISHRLWMSHFNGERSAVGRTVTIDGKPTTIIGVMPASFDITPESDALWIPLALPPQAATKFSEHYFQVFARIRSNTTLQQAQAAATAAEQRVAARNPDRGLPVSSYGVVLHRYIEDFVGDYRALLLVLLGAVSLVLLIACGNVANLLLARGATRAKELAIRAALGAGRGRLLRQLLTESLMLAVVGSLAGLLLAFALVKIIVSVSPTDVPRIEQAGIDWRVLVFTLGTGVVSSVLFGLLPALRSVGPRMQSTLREAGHGSRIGRDHLRGVLVTAEVALAITLLIGSGLLIRSAWSIEHVDLGFDPRGVLTARLMLPEARYSDGASITRLFLRVRDDAARIPGIRSSALTLLPPLTGDHLTSSVSAPGTASEKTTQASALGLVSDGYFATMGIRLVAGRDIDRHDVATSPLVVVINEALARQLWPSRDPREAIGKRINAMAFAKNEPHLMTIVGIAANLQNAALDKPPAPEFYAPVTQTPEKLWPIIQRSLVVVLRAANRDANPDAFIQPLRTVIARIDSALPIAEARSMESFRRASIETARMNTLLLSILGGIALVLAMVGTYGVVSYFVSQRTHEIGIRMALGATPARVCQFVVQHGLRPILAGLGLGVGLSFLATSVLREQLYGVTAHDPLTMAAVSATLLLVALVAMYLPARRAMQVAPVVALNEG